MTDEIARRAFRKFTAERQWSQEEVGALGDYIRDAGKTFKSEEHARESLAGHLRSRHFPPDEVEAFTEFARAIAEDGIYTDDYSVAPPEQPTVARETSQPVENNQLASIQSQMRDAMRSGEYFKPSVEAQSRGAIQEATGSTPASRQALADEVGGVIEATPGSGAQFHAQQIRELHREEGGYERYWKAVQSDPVVDATSRAAFAGEAAEQAPAPATGGE